MREYRKVLDEVQPHVYAAVAAAVAIAAAAATQASQNKANRARKRNNANANQVGSQGQMDVSTPTALQFSDNKGAVSPTRANPSPGSGDELPSLPQGARMSDLLGGSKNVSSTQQGQSVGGLKSLDTAPPPSTPAPITDANPYTEMPKTEVASSGTTAGEVGGYAQQALALYSAYDQLRKSGIPQPQPAAQVGPMNLQPTARRFGV